MRPSSVVEWSAPGCQPCIRSSRVYKRPGRTSYGRRRSADAMSAKPIKTRGRGQARTGPWGARPGTPTGATRGRRGDALGVLRNRPQGAETVTTSTPQLSLWTNTELEDELAARLATAPGLVRPGAALWDDARTPIHPLSMESAYADPRLLSDLGVRGARFARELGADVVVGAET